MNDTAVDTAFDRALALMLQQAKRYQDGTWAQREAYYRQCKRRLSDMALRPRQYERAIIALADAVRL